MLKFLLGLFLGAVGGMIFGGMCKDGKEYDKSHGIE